MTTLCRQWYERGKDFVVKTKQGRENLYCFAAVSPETGDIYTMNGEKSNMECMKEFLEGLAKKFGETRILMIMDRASWHTSKKLIIPDTIIPLFLPPLSPQLNPVEHLWKHIRTEKFHNNIFDSIEDVIEALNTAISELSANVLMSLCACSYL